MARTSRVVVLSSDQPSFQGGTTITPNEEIEKLQIDVAELQAEVSAITPLSEQEYLFLPPRIDVQVLNTLTIYLRWVFIPYDSTDGDLSDYTWTVALGQTSTSAPSSGLQEFSWSPGDADVGWKVATISVYRSGTKVAEGQTFIVVSPRTTNARTVNVLLIGDSITAAAGCDYPNQVKATVAACGLTPSFRGSIAPAGASAGVFVEAIAGTTMQYWAKNPASAFFNGGPRLDFAGWLGAGALDVCIIGLGTNSMATAPTNDDPAKQNYAADAIDAAALLIQSIKEAVPACFVGLLPLFATKADQASFTADYGAGPPTYWGYQRDRYYYMQELMKLHNPSGGVEVLGSGTIINGTTEMLNAIHPAASGAVLLGKLIGAYVQSRAP